MGDLLYLFLFAVVHGRLDLHFLVCMQIIESGRQLSKIGSSQYLRMKIFPNGMLFLLRHLKQSGGLAFSKLLAFFNIVKRTCGPRNSNESLRTLFLSGIVSHSSTNCIT